MAITDTNLLTREELLVIEKAKRSIFLNGRTRLGMNYDPWKYHRLENIGIVLGIFEELRVPSTLKIDEDRILEFILGVESGYQEVPYHSFRHSLDVVVKLHYFLRDMFMMGYFTKFDLVAILIAGLCHDIGHPGLNNTYQINLNSELAKKYPISTLEKHSVGITLDLINSTNLFKYLKNESTNRYIDESIDETDVPSALISQIKMSILYTDMTQHFNSISDCKELVNTLSERVLRAFGDDKIKSSVDNKSFNTLGDFKSFHQVNGHFESASGKIVHYCDQVLERNKIGNAKISREKGLLVDSIKCQKYSSRPIENIPLEGPVANNNPLAAFLEPGGLLNSRERRTLSSVLVHLADISNPVLPWGLSRAWSDMMTLESLSQAESERLHGLPMTLSMHEQVFDQCHVSIAFSKLIVKPLFLEFEHLIPVDNELLCNLELNTLKWKEVQKEGQAICITNKESGLTKEIPSTCKNHNNAPTIRAESQAKTSYLATGKPEPRKLSVAAGTLEIPSVKLSHATNTTTSLCFDQTRDVGFMILDFLRRNSLYLLDSIITDTPCSKLGETIVRSRSFNGFDFDTRVLIISPSSGGKPETLRYDRFYASQKPNNKRTRHRNLVGFSKLGSEP